MKKVKKDQWKLAASWAADISKGMFLGVFGLGISGKAGSSWVITIALLAAIVALFLAWNFARRGDKDGDDHNGS